jgi:hypothetical protein
MLLSCLQLGLKLITNVDQPMPVEDEHLSKLPASPCPMHDTVYSGLQKYSPSAETSENHAGTRKSAAHAEVNVFSIYINE